MTVSKEFRTEVIGTMKVAAACIGLAFLIGAMAVALFLPLWLFVKLTGISP